MKDLKERLAAQGVHTLIAQFTDLHGVARGKYVPLAHLDDLLTEGAGFAGPSIAGSGLPGHSSRNVLMCAFGLLQVFTPRDSWMTRMKRRNALSLPASSGFERSTGSEMVTPLV